jgi:tRNA pseudouridine38-40 synthase
LNSSLPDDIIVSEISRCPSGFHPRYDTKSREYIYRILNGRTGDFMLRDFVWHIPQKIDWEKVRKGIKLINGKHDFSLFSTDNENKNTVIKVTAGLKKPGELFELNFKARNFLTHMIRYLTGFLIAVGKGKEDIEKLKGMLNGQGEPCICCAPPKGLILSGTVLKKC